ncbi:hypothetical protein TCAL_06816 [Tigriopus californicus]|uniref:Dipeptidase n=1 Tax=Tigriopus californicus TaxID=6832 RepID=A0A553PLB5_TIGCA|nr:dipeptidase 1-like [Tigriopus californicus]TRY78475.1 hypothetical protein TCAL_06816 [Tigriopus californicus]
MKLSDNFVYSKRDLVVVGIAIGLIVALLGVGFGVSAKPAVPMGRSELPPQSSFERALSILEEAPVIDGHNDFAMTVRDLFQNDLSKFNFNSNLSEREELSDYPMDHTDLPRLRKGRIGAQFWSAYVSCGSQYKDAVQLFMEQIDFIKRLVNEYPNDLQFATSTQDILDGFKSKKIASLIGVESGHAIGSSVAILRTLYELGARYMTLTHTCNTPWADSSEAEQNIPPRSQGLSDFGQLVVQEMNRLGMLVDISHVSKDTMKDALSASKAPVMFSHSSARALCSQARNVPDEVLLDLKSNGGIIMVNFYSCFLIDDCQERNATVLDVVAHINHIRNLIGVDHIGLGGDFNGVESLPIGLEDTSKYPNLFVALLEDKTHDWTEAELAQISSGNLLRVFKKVEDVRDMLKRNDPEQTWIDPNDLHRSETSCQSETS